MQKGVASAEEAHKQGQHSAHQQSAVTPTKLSVNTDEAGKEQNTGQIIKNLQGKETKQSKNVH